MTTIEVITLSVSEIEQILTNYNNLKSNSKNDLSKFISLIQVKYDDVISEQSVTVINFNSELKNIESLKIL